MNINTWTIKVHFVQEVKFDTQSDERRSNVAMKGTLEHLIRECGFFPRQDDIIFDMNDDEEFFIIDALEIHPNTKTVEFVLADPESNDPETDE